MTLKIEILSRSQALYVDPAQWDQLAESSKLTNPFFERWALLPALQYLQKNDHVSLVVAYHRGQLVALFPIIKNLHKIGMKYIAVWKHEHCFLCDPLCSMPDLLGEIVDTLLEQMHANIFRIEAHSTLAFARHVDSRSVIFRATRGAIFKTQQTSLHLNQLPQKIRQENQRISKRFFEKSSASYFNSDMRSDIDWLDDYFRLEHAGWKGRANGSILSDSGIAAYYSALYRSEHSASKIKFQGLYSSQGPLAISVRLVSNNRAFDIKTTFDENFRELYPGVNLELCNMRDLENFGYEYVDSCTLSDNYLVNRLWPDQREILTSVYFKAGFISQLLKKVYQFKNRHSLNS